MACKEGQFHVVQLKLLSISLKITPVKIGLEEIEKLQNGLK